MNLGKVGYCTHIIIMPANIIMLWLRRNVYIVIYCLTYIGDPLDNKYVEVSQSKISIDAGDGAFAKTDVPLNTAYVLYSGKIFNKGRQHEGLTNMQQNRIKYFMKSEENATKIIQYSDSLNKYR